MTASVTDAMAGIIRQVDGNNTLSATELGRAITAKFPPFFGNQHGADLIALVERTNPDKAMGAGRLAELIVAEFDLDKEG
jgi:hypothetical protein